MNETKSDQFNPKDLLTIPNIITYIRVLCIPVFVVLSILAGMRNDTSFVYWALGVFAFAAASDLVDGYLARRFNWSTGLGMLLDPFADKLMHISVALCLAFAIKIDGVNYLHWAFIVAIIFKELYMILCAPIIAKKGIEIKANMIGKVASATLSGGIILCFFHPYVAPWDWAIIATSVVQSYFAAGFYTVDVLRQLKQIKLNEEASSKGETIENSKTENSEIDNSEIEKKNVEVESLELAKNGNSKLPGEINTTVQPSATANNETAANTKATAKSNTTEKPKATENTNATAKSNVTEKPKTTAKPKTATVDKQVQSAKADDNTKTAVAKTATAKTAVAKTTEAKKANTKSKTVANSNEATTTKEN
ncbi:MAG: CDP-alcohol phosphatidyltransferase family protein [Clostridia bacterium]|nr:CDP-alcohol phosphatidyltransferase family protein [Clostridia bacterium]